MSAPAERIAPPRGLVIALAAMAGLFACRVLGQMLVTARGGVPWLPPAEAWT